MGPGNDAARIRTASVSQDQRKCLRTASVRQDQRKYLKWVLLVTVPRTVLDATAASPSAPSPLHGEGWGEASVRQDQRKNKEGYMLKELISRKLAPAVLQRETITK